MANRQHPSPRGQLAAVRTLQREIAALHAMTVCELAKKYKEVFGVPTRTRNKDYLLRHVAWKVQADHEGRPPPSALERLMGLAAHAPVRWRAPAPDAITPAELKKTARDPRLPRPGTVLQRVYNGVLHEVTVLASGVEYRGQTYRSLSQIARRITGKDWNGFRFFLGNKTAKLDGDQ